MAVILTGKEGSLSRLLFVEAIYLIEMSGEWRGSSFLSNFLEKNITKHPGFSQLCNVISLDNTVCGERGEKLYNKNMTDMPV